MFLQPVVRSAPLYQVYTKRFRTRGKAKRGGGGKDTKRKGSGRQTEHKTGRNTDGKHRVTDWHTNSQTCTEGRYKNRQIHKTDKTRQKKDKSKTRARQEQDKNKTRQTDRQIKRKRQETCLVKPVEALLHLAVADDLVVVEVDQQRRHGGAVVIRPIECRLHVARHKHAVGVV